ncbi:MAG: hypothetical protein KTR30_07315 [Saprospiraceae bacterium]|nr:hypothetical protein [Saprospiraceae bacterium]
MKSLLFSLTVVSLFVISTYNSSDSPSIKLEIPDVIDLNKADLDAIAQQIESNTAFAEIEVYDKWGEKIYQSQDRQSLLADITPELDQQTSPLLYVLKFNISEEKDKLNSQIGQLVW